MGTGEYVLRRIFLIGIFSWQKRCFPRKIRKNEIEEKFYKKSFENTLKNA
jgi:hypothetical protein